MPTGQDPMPMGHRWANDPRHGCSGVRLFSGRALLLAAAQPLGWGSGAAAPGSRRDGGLPTITNHHCGEARSAGAERDPPRWDAAPRSLTHTAQHGAWAGHRWAPTAPQGGLAAPRRAGMRRWQRSRGSGCVSAAVLGARRRAGSRGCRTPAPWFPPRFPSVVSRHWHGRESRD